MEYGDDDDEDDDLEETTCDTVKAISNVQIASKPFWAVWSWKISSYPIYLVNRKSLLVLLVTFNVLQVQVRWQFQWALSILVFSNVYQLWIVSFEFYFEDQLINAVKPFIGWSQHWPGWYQKIIFIAGFIFSCLQCFIIFVFDLG